MNIDDRSQAKALDRYLTALQAGQSPEPPPDLPAGEAALLHELLSLPGANRPDADFAAQLEAQLIDAARRRGSDPRPSRAGLGARLAALLGAWNGQAAFALAAVAVVALLGAALLLANRPPSDPEARLARATPTASATPRPTMTPTRPPRATATPVAALPTATALPATVEPTSFPPTATAISPTAPPVEPMATPTALPDPTATAMHMLTPPALPPLAAAMGSGMGGGGVSAGPTEIRLTLSTALPEGPAQAPAYVQQPLPPLTPAQTRELAARLGLHGSIYQPFWMSRAASVPGQRVYVAVDGVRQAAAESGGRLTYHNPAAKPPSGPAAPIPAEEAVAGAEAFLQAAGLLEVPYMTSYSVGTVHFYRLVDGRWPVHGPFASVTLAPGPEVSGLTYQQLALEPQGAYALIPASQAWEQLLARLAQGEAAPEDQIWYRVTWHEQAAQPRFWQRTYDAGAQVDIVAAPHPLFGLDPDAPPYATLNGLALEGDLDPLLQAHLQAQRESGDTEAPLHVWGQVADRGTYQALVVAGWQAVSGAPHFWLGTIQRQAGQGTLVTEAGAALPLPDLPADLADGTPVYVQGGEIEGQLEWSQIQEQQLAADPPCAGGCPALDMAIEEAALIYVVPAPQAVPPELLSEKSYRALHPVWRFAGHSAAGDAFEAYVQAVHDQYNAEQ